MEKHYGAMIDSVFGLHNSLSRFDEKDDGGKMDVDSTPHASPDNGEADQAGSFLFKQPPAALTYDQLVDKLIDKGLVIDEGERPHVINVLSYIGYYRLRGYWMTLEKNKRFYAGVLFSDIEGIYALDSALRHWLLGAIEPIEVKLRAQLAHHLALAYGPDAFYSPEPFLSAAQWEGSMRAVRREIERARREGKPSVCHNLEVYGKLPAWSLVDNTSIGTLSKLFGNLRQGDVVDAICEAFGVRRHYLKSWFELLTYTRNLSAHDDRFYNRVMKKRAALLREDRPYAGPKEFPVFLVIRQLYLHNWSTEWGNRYANLERIIAAHPNVDLKPMGFPENWADILDTRPIIG